MILASILAGAVLLVILADALPVAVMLGAQMLTGTYSDELQ